MPKKLFYALGCFNFALDIILRIFKLFSGSSLDAHATDWIFLVAGMVFLCLGLFLYMNDNKEYAENISSEHWLEWKKHKADKTAEFWRDNMGPMLLVIFLIVIALVSKL